MSDKDLIVDEVVSTAKRLEEMDIEDFESSGEVLDVKLTVFLNGTVRKVVLVLTTGGPHIELNVSNGTVTGHWGSDSHTTHMDNEQLCDYLHERYTELFEIQN